MLKVIKLFRKTRFFTDPCTGRLHVLGLDLLQYEWTDMNSEMWAITFLHVVYILLLTDMDGCKLPGSDYSAEQEVDQVNTNYIM